MDTTTNSGGEGFGELRRTDPSTYRGTGYVSCPECGYSTDAIGGTTHDPIDAPGDGDYSVCFQCAAVAVIVKGPFGLALRAATAAEVVDCDRKNPGVRARLRAFNAEHPR